MQYIYEIRNTKNGKRYIGRTNNPQRRKSTHFNDLRKEKHINGKLQNAFNKYGEKSFVFSVIEEIEDDSTIEDVEQSYLDSDEDLYNISKSSRGPGRYIFYGKDNGFYGKKHTEETKREIGRKASERYQGENNPFYGKKHTEESKRKMSKSLQGVGKGIPKSEEHKEKMRKGSPSNRAAIINDIEYYSIMEASRQLGIKRETIGYRVKSNSKKFKGYKFKE